jgi:glutathione synthase/RimK-type ligase-like ATP-grasp enzyme
MSTRGGENRRVAPGQGGRVPLNVLFGLPDDEKAWIIVEEDGQPLNYDLPGTVGMLPYLSRERFSPYVIYLKSGRTQPLRLGPGALLNHIAEPDACALSLELARRIVAKVDRPCFNHPSAVAGTTRDAVARALAGIPGLHVPKTIRLQEREPDALREAVERAVLDYPVLVRIAGTHLGMSMIRIERPENFDAVLRLNRTDRSSLYATEFRDFASPDGKYRKFRIAVVGDEIFLRHVYISDQWLIHRAEHSASMEEEAALLGCFEHEWCDWLKPLCREVARRLDLDFFGIDCSIDPKGEVLLFEANACMKILGYTGPRPNTWEVPIARIKAAVEARLSAPALWRHYDPQRGAKPLNAST